MLFICYEHGYKTNFDSHKEDHQNSRSQALPLFYPLNSKIGIRILHTVLYTLPMVL